MFRYKPINKKKEHVAGRLSNILVLLQQILTIHLLHSSVRKNFWYDKVYLPFQDFEGHKYFLIFTIIWWKYEASTSITKKNYKISFVKIYKKVNNKYCEVFFNVT